VSERVKLTVNGMEITARRGATVLEAALENGIYIPHLCYHPDLKPAAVCRLCLVEVEGRGMVTSCNTPAEEGMVVFTDTPEVSEARRVSVELLLADHHTECGTCARNGDCELQRAARYIGVEPDDLRLFRKPSDTKGKDTSNPFFVRDLDKCVLCGICVRTCAEIVGAHAIDFVHRGYAAVIGTFAGKPLPDTTCVSCGECVARCPVGALVPVEAEEPGREVLTTCGYCGCGCGIYLGVRGTRIVSARGDRENPVNRGNLCVKGRFGYGFVNSPERLTTPLIRRNGAFEEVSWDEALDYVAEKLSRYRGGDVAVLSSAKCTNEDNYVVQKFARVVLGTNNVDHCARLCHAPTVAGLASTFGSGAMTNSIREIGDAACIFAIGSNTTQAHPIVALEMVRAKRGGAKLIVANPRRIELCRHADLFLQHRPGTDVLLMLGMMKVIVSEGLEDADFIRERCENFEEFKASVDACDLDVVEKETGVPRDALVRAARIYAGSKPASIVYAMGITQHTHGTDNVIATADLALLTGNVGKPSAGVNPLRGQNNVQGACDLGALPNVFPGYQKVTDAAAREKFEKAWGVELPGEPGLTHVEIFHAVAEGRVKALYQVGENPVISEADANQVKKALEKIEFLVVQDIFMSDTARFAHVVLPAASFAEKDGTFTNTERRIQRVRKAVPCVGEARPDWWITCEIAKRMGAEGFAYTGPAEIMEEIASLTPIYGGISYERLEKGGIQWPCPDADHPGTPFLYADGFKTPSGRARFVPLSYRPSAELPDEEYPLVLTTERSLYHFHTGTMTRRVAGLAAIRNEEWVEMNPRDAEALGIRDGDTVRVVSRRGEVTAKALVSDVSPPGVVSMTFHFAESPTNELTNAALDPVAKIPETKVCAVRVEKT